MFRNDHDADSARSDVLLEVLGQLVQGLVEAHGCDDTRATLTPTPGRVLRHLRSVRRSRLRLLTPGIGLGKEQTELHPQGHLVDGTKSVRAQHP